MKAISTTECMLWARNLDSYGYGFWTTLIEGKRYQAHKVMYELVFGSVPSGLQLDHLCRTPPCVNPDHLEAVTHKVNMGRGTNALKTHCPKGHKYTSRNTYTIRSTNGRMCRECSRIRARRAGSKYYERRKICQKQLYQA